jgi:hypothetical protein
MVRKTYDENLLVIVVTAGSALISTTGEYGVRLLTISSQKYSLISQMTHNAAGSTQDYPNDQPYFDSSVGGYREMLVRETCWEKW